MRIDLEVGIMGHVWAFVRRHRVATGVAAVVALGVAVFGFVWFEPHKLFIDERVDEPLPVAAAEPTPALEEEAPSDEPEESDDSEPAGPEVLARGPIRPLNHGPASGGVRILRLEDGRIFLRLENLSVDNGPDLRVYLSETTAAEGSAREESFLDGFVDLGELKGNIGSSNYRVPGDADLGRYESVVVWCRRFSVGFAVAQL